jgi:transposase
VILSWSDLEWEGRMTRAVAIRTGLCSPAELRRRARCERDRRAARRMLAVASALEGLPRAEAARLAGMERQALRDTVLRYNAEGLAGLRDRVRPGRPPTLGEAEQALLRAVILRGPEPERDGCREWTLPALCRWIEARFDKRLRPASLSRVVRGLDLSRQKTRPLHPQADAAAQAAFKKRLSCLSSSALPSYDPGWTAAPQGWRVAPPPSAASALTRRGPSRSGF